MNDYKTILVMGAGAVGGYFGGRIAQLSSANVALIARGSHLEAIQKKGLQIKNEDSTATIAVDAFEHPQEAPRPDLIFFTVKSYDTSSAIKQIRPIVDDKTQILTIQNGIENYPKLAEAFGRENVIQGFCRIGAGIAQPGVIHYEAFGEITAGEKSGRTSDRLQALQALCDDADIPLHITSNINRKVWLKFAWNCVFNMTTAVANVTVEKLFQSQETEALCYDLFDEIRMVAKAEGVELLDEDAKNIIEPARDLKGFTTSTYQDRQKGKKLEYEAFTGAIVRLAEKHRLDVPYNETMYALLKLIDNDN